MTDAFGVGPALALGVEEELLLVDDRTFALAGGASSIVAGRGPVQQLGAMRRP